LAGYLKVIIKSFYNGFPNVISASIVCKIIDMKNIHQK
jgi:hypothetical protein